MAVDEITKAVDYLEVINKINEAIEAVNASIKALSVSGKTITYTKTDGSTGTITTQDNNTTYSAGTGLSLSGTTFSLGSSGVTAGSYGPSAAVTGTEGNTINIPYITVDKYGRITSVSNKVLTNKDRGIVAQSLGTNGYVKFQNGLILQWGKTTPTKSSGSVYYFSKPISCTTYACLAVDSATSDSGGKSICWLSARSASATEYIYASDPGQFSFIIIGK